MVKRPGLLKYFASRAKQEKRERDFELQTLTLKKEKSALKNQLDDTMDELSEVRSFCNCGTVLSSS